jgi:hypothetical protein
VQRQVANIEQTGKAQYDQAIKDQDPARARAGVEMLASVGVIHPKNVAGMLAQIQPKIQVEQMNNAILNNPGMAPDLIMEKDEDGKFVNWKNVDDKTREQILRESQRRQSVFQTQNAQNVVQDIDNGVVYSEEKLSQMQDAGEIFSAGRQFDQCEDCPGNQSLHGRGSQAGRRRPEGHGGGFAVRYHRLRPEYRQLQEAVRGSA